MDPPRRSLAVTLHDLSTPPRGPFTSRNETPISRMSRSKRPAANCSRRSLSRFKTVRAVASKTRIRNNMGFPFFKSPALLRSPAGSDIFLDGRALTRMPTAYERAPVPMERTKRGLRQWRSASRTERVIADREWRRCGLDKAFQNAKLRLVSEAFSRRALRLGVASLMETTSQESIRCRRAERSDSCVPRSRL